MIIWKMYKTPSQIVQYENRLMNSTIAYEHLKEGDLFGENLRIAEKSISSNYDISYMYARYVLKGRFPLGEAVISTDAHTSLYYARDVISGRFELGEAAISTNIETALNYAKEAIKGRFPLGEAVISTIAINSYWYANVIHERFFLGEPLIAKDATIAFWYAEDVIKGRFPLGEATILASTFRRRYGKLCSE